MDDCAHTHIFIRVVNTQWILGIHFINTTHANAAYRLCILNADAPLWRARGRRFFDSAVAASVFHEGLCFGPGWLFLRFNVSAFILGYRMRARFCNARDLSFLASREYISRAEARVRFVICGALGRSGCAKNGNIARRYPFNNYEFF